MKIVITTDNVTTTANLYNDNKLVKSAASICNPEDTFNFEVGAKLALERLMVKPEVPHRFNIGDVVVVKNSGSQYSTYSKWFIDNMIDDSVYKKTRGCLDNGDAVKISAFGEHGSLPSAGTLYAVEKSNGDVGLIAEYGLSEQEYYNGKVVCVDNDNDWGWTIGKIYEVDNGVLCWNDGENIACNFTSLKHINEYFARHMRITHAKFIELVE